MLRIIAASALAAFSLFFFPLAVFAQPREQNTSAIGLKNFQFDVKKGEPAVPPGLQGRPSSGNHNFIIIKFKGKDNSADRDRLAKLGVRFFGYIPVNAFFAKAPKEKINDITNDTAVEYVGPYRPAYRLDTDVLEWVKQGEKGEKKLVLQAFDGEDLGPIKKAVESLGGSWEVISDTPGLNGKFLKVRVDASRIPDLADVDGVEWIEVEKTPTLFNDISNTVIKADYLWGLGVPLRGTGQVVGICDTGLDTGNISTLHADFAAQTSGGLTRVKQTYSYGRTNNWSDTDGHGTHTSGSIVGAGVKSNQLSPGMYIRGMAYDAQLVFQSVLNSSGGLTIPDINSVVFPDAYSVGARLHSNSWGYSSSNGAYNSDSVRADTYTWNHKDFLPFFAAGNDGIDANKDGIVDLGSVSAPGTAKNVLTVGASENYRPTLTLTYGHGWPTTYTTDPISSDMMANNVNGMAAFSGRGSTADGRIKPDLVAPGTWVLSDKSSLAPSGNYWAKPSYASLPSALDTYYAFDGGTSMATPLTAGAAALVREFLVSSGFSSPSGAMIKCAMIAGAADVSPGQYSSPKNDVTARPDNNQGWGRVDLKESLYPDLPKRTIFDDYTTGLQTGGFFNYSYLLSDATVPVRVNLVWTDYPGTANASPNLVNDLDLVVTAPDGRVYHGNRYSGSASVPNDQGFDRLNNVEGVTIPPSSLTAGSLSVKVQAYSVQHGPQPYAIVISGAVYGKPVVNAISPSSGINNVQTGVLISGGSFAPGASLYVGSVQCQVTSVNPTNISGIVPVGMPAGPYAVKVVNPDSQFGILDAGFQSIGDTTVPAAPRGLHASPGNASINVQWTQNTEPDLSGYRVYFSGYSTTVGNVGSRRLTGLVNGQNYDITARAVDYALNVSPAAGPVSATPVAPEPDLPHYSWDGSPAWSCGSCHTSGTGSGFLPVGFSYKSAQELCLSCHNTASVAHGRPITEKSSHKTLVNVTAGGSRRPSYGAVTSGEYSDSMYSHLKDGDKVVCVTCHNAMRKPNDVGRSWEYTSSTNNIVFKLFRGGWWDQGHISPGVYNDDTLWTPSHSRDREALRVDAAKYRFDEYTGRIIFNSTTPGYVYANLDDPYLRVPGGDNTICADCHAVEKTHQSLNCLACHGAHGMVNIKGVKSKVRMQDGVSRDVVFMRYTGVNSFADGAGAIDGICEVCHTATLYYRFDGSGGALHLDGNNYSGRDCSACHTHTGGFGK